MMMLLQHCANTDNNQFKQVTKDSDLLNGIHDDVGLYGDQVYQLADEIWLEVIHEDSNQCESIVTVTQYLDLIRENVQGFVYEQVYDESGCVNGVMWQTAIMI